MISPCAALDSLMAMASKKAKADEKADEALQWLKRSRARRLRLPAELASRLDVMEAIANNRAITTLDLSECEVCSSQPCLRTQWLH
jgi:hypothetical protein